MRKLLLLGGALATGVGAAAMWWRDTDQSSGPFANVEALDRSDTCLHLQKFCKRANKLLTKCNLTYTLATAGGRTFPIGWPPRMSILPGPPNFGILHSYLTHQMGKYLKSAQNLVEQYTPIFARAQLLLGISAPLPDLEWDNPGIVVTVTPIRTHLDMFRLRSMVKTIRNNLNSAIKLAEYLVTLLEEKEK